MDRNTKFYQDFFNLYTKAYPDISGPKAQSQANDIWRKMRINGADIDCKSYNEEISRLRKRIENKSGSIKDLFNNKKQIQRRVTPTHQKILIKKLLLQRSFRKSILMMKLKLKLKRRMMRLNWTKPPMTPLPKMH